MSQFRHKRLKREDSAAVEALLDLNATKHAITEYPRPTFRTTRKVIQDESGNVVLIKGSWSPDEDKTMLGAVNVYGFDWKRVAACVNGRSAKQCRDRYRLKLDPSINHGPWTQEEDDKLLSLHNEMGRCWTKIAKLLPGRTENAVKSRYSSLFRAKTKEWSQSEEDLLQNLHRQGISFGVIAKQHLPHRSEHAVKKRYEKLLMKQIASQIKEDLPTLKQNQSQAGISFPTLQSVQLPKLNPILAAATVSTVSTPAPKLNELPGSREDIINSLGLKVQNQVANIDPITKHNNAAMINPSSRFKRTLTGSSTFSTGMTFLLPSNIESKQEEEVVAGVVRPIQKHDSNSSEHSRSSSGQESYCNENTEEKSADFDKPLPLSQVQSSNNEQNVVNDVVANPTNRVLEKVKKTGTRRLKRYSTSTTVLMQLIGEPMS